MEKKYTMVVLYNGGMIFTATVNSKQKELVELFVKEKLFDINVDIYYEMGVNVEHYNFIE